MSLSQGLDGFRYQIILTYHFDLIFSHPFHDTLLPQKRIASFQSPKLSLPQGLPGTTVIIANPPRAHCEHRLLYLFHMSFRNEKCDLIHTASFLRIVQSEHFVLCAKQALCDGAERTLCDATRLHLGILLDSI